MVRAFSAVLRGYDMRQVDDLLDRAASALASNDRTVRRSVSDELRSAAFRWRLRGYDRRQVDLFVEDLVRELG